MTEMTNSVMKRKISDLKDREFQTGYIYCCLGLWLEAHDQPRWFCAISTPSTRGNASGFGDICGLSRPHLVHFLHCRIQYMIGVWMYGERSARTRSLREWKACLLQCSTEKMGNAEERVRTVRLWNWPKYLLYHTVIMGSLGDHDQEECCQIEQMPPNYCVVGAELFHDKISQGIHFHLKLKLALLLYRRSSWLLTTEEHTLWGHAPKQTRRTTQKGSRTKPDWMRMYWNCDWRICKCDERLWTCSGLDSWWWDSGYSYSPSKEKCLAKVNLHQDKRYIIPRGRTE